MLSLRDAMDGAGVAAMSALARHPPPISVRTVVVDRLIDAKWRALGATYSRLGGPWGELAGAGGAYAREFEGGKIRWLSGESGDDLSGLVEYESTVRIAQITCVHKSNDGSDSDEPYLIAAVLNARTPNTIPVFKLPEGDGEDDGAYRKFQDGDTRHPLKVVWQGPPANLDVRLALFETDQGHPEDVEKDIAAKIKEAGTTLAAAEGVQVPPDWMDTISVGLASWITDALRLADDLLGEAVIPISKHELREAVPQVASPDEVWQSKTVTIKTPDPEDPGEYVVRIEYTSVRIQDLV